MLSGDDETVTTNFERGIAVCVLQSDFVPWIEIHCVVLLYEENNVGVRNYALY